MSLIYKNKCLISSFKVNCHLHLLIYYWLENVNKEIQYVFSNRIY